MFIPESGETGQVSDIMFIQELGNRIRDRRETLGLKQNDIAHALQVSPQAVSKWERGENAPDITILVPLVKLLGVSAGWLLGANIGQDDVFEATVFVSDVLGFADRVQGMSEKDVAGWINGFFHQITEAVLQYDGVPVKYMGDGFLAFFSGPDHQGRAVRAARTALNTVSEKLAIALNCGSVYLGAIGHHDYRRPDILGDAVNLTFRLITRQLENGQGGMIMNRAVADAADASGGRKEQVSFKGVPEAVDVYIIKAG